LEPIRLDDDVIIDKNQHVSRGLSDSAGESERFPRLRLE
jgi:hypothetical protein